MRQSRVLNIMERIKVVNAKVNICCESELSQKAIRVQASKTYPLQKREDQSETSVHYEHGYNPT